METLNNLIGGLLDASPPFVLGFALWVLGVFLKSTPRVENWCIPFVMAFGGAILYPFVAEVGKVSYNVRSPLMFNVVMGFGIGGGAVLADQMRKRWLEFKGAKGRDEDTKFFHRESDEPKELKRDPPNIGSTPGLP